MHNETKHVKKKIIYAIIIFIKCFKLKFMY